MCGGSQQFTYSKVMAWVAFDRCCQEYQRFGVDGPADRWRVLRKAIHDEVCENGFNSEIGAFVQSYGSKQLDASATHSIGRISGAVRSALHIPSRRLSAA